jgi:prepilin-type N-terminal cleavage/methylation domain-containing protein
MMDRSGVTLIELIVALAILALGTSVVGLAIRATPPARGANPIAVTIASVRDSAIRTRRSVTSILMVSDSVRAVTALPDGRIITDSVVRAQLSSDEAHHVAP